nr:PTS fructose transporter subunit IIC [Clostridium paraputrificum]
MFKKLNIKKHVMTGISYMIPIVVCGGLCMAIGKAVGGWDVGSQEGTIAFMINSLGSAAMQFVVPVLTAGIAYSIAERPGIAPGLVLGFISVQIKAGFLGGMLIGIILGYFILWMKTWKVPKFMAGLMPVMIIPLVSTFVCGLAFLLVLSKPIIWLMAALQAWILSLQGGSKFLLGAAIGACMGFDLGGPVNKTASAVANGLGADGIFGPMSAKIVGGMTPPLGIGLAALIARKKFSKTEVEMAKTAVPMGLCFITEGVLPFAAADPIRVIASTMLGSATAGGLAVMWGCESIAGHGGIFIVPQMVNPLMFLLALAIGSVVTAVSYAILKRPLDQQVDKEEEIIDLDIDIKIQ